jgi:predicted RNA-binding protein with PIN domain
MRYVIDGYNLLYAMGVLPSRLGPTGLQKARLALLGLLKAVYAEDAGAVTVVFDAANAVPGAAEVYHHEGIQVRFAVNEPEADDVIESLIRQESVPRRLTVVSDDHRIQQAAWRRHCVVLGCGEYLDVLARQRPKKHQPGPDLPVKSASSSEQETEHWLREFADLAEDPAMKRLSDPPEWLDIDVDRS